MKKIMRRMSFLLPLLALGYVVGLVWALQSSVTTGHTIFAFLAVMGMIVTFLSFGRYDDVYRNASIHRSVFLGSLLVGAIFFALLIVHVVALMTHAQDLFWVSGLEVVTASVATVVWLAWFNNERSKVPDRYSRYK